MQLVHLYLLTATAAAALTTPFRNPLSFGIGKAARRTQSSIPEGGSDISSTDEHSPHALREYVDSIEYNFTLWALRNSRDRPYTDRPMPVGFVGSGKGIPLTLGPKTNFTLQDQMLAAYPESEEGPLYVGVYHTEAPFVLVPDAADATKMQAVVIEIRGERHFSMVTAERSCDPSGFTIDNWYHGRVVTRCRDVFGLDLNVVERNASVDLDELFTRDDVAVDKVNVENTAQQALEL